MTGPRGRSDEAAARTVIRRVAFAVCLILCASSPLLSQTTTSTLTGRVRTADGRPVEGVDVQARSDTTGVTRASVTSKDGRYRIDLLQPGAWTITARRGPR